MVLLKYARHPLVLLQILLQLLVEPFIPVTATGTMTFQVLYPPSGTDVRTEDLDLTMWVMLVRNATTASDKSVKRMKGLAPNNEQLVRDHVFKIRNARNVLFHKARHELDETEFDQIWLDVSAAILYLRRITPGERDVNYAYVLEQLKVCG